MKIYSVTEARKILGELINRVKYQKQVIALGKHGKAEVIMLSYSPEDDFPIEALSSASDSFDFLEREPDLYSRDDLKKRYV
jgi:hypothetical protein